MVVELIFGVVDEAEIVDASRRHHVDYLGHQLDDGEIILLALCVDVAASAVGHAHEAARHSLRVSSSCATEIFFRASGRYGILGNYEYATIVAFLLCFRLIGLHRIDYGFTGRNASLRA